MHRLFQSKPAVHSDGSGTARVAVNYTHSATANVRDSDGSRICVLPFLPYRVYLHLLALYYARVCRIIQVFCSLAVRTTLLVSSLQRFFALRANDAKGNK